MYIEGLIVCIDFGDFLATTLPLNRPNFDRLTIVTSSDDKRTRLLARQHDCQIVTTTRHKEPNKFNKMKAINDGLDACSKKGWLAILDADIALSQNFRVDIENQINLRLIPDKLETKRTIYGLQRYMCWSKPEWKAFLKTGKHKWELDKKRKCAQAPAGYFQLWYAKNQTKLYHEDWAANSNRLIRGGYHRDLDFARQFGHCRHLPCPYVVHLATRTEGMRDYNGRVSTKW